MQSKTSLGIFRFLAGFVSVYHLILGLIGTFASTETVVWVVTRVYGVVPTIDAQFTYLAKFIAAYMIVFAITTAILAWKPVEYRKLVWVPITLFTIRIIERLVFFGLLTEAFQITMARNLQVIIPIAIIAVALYYFKPKAGTSY
jgi:hypothetical protein